MATDARERARRYVEAVRAGQQLELWPRPGMTFERMCRAIARAIVETRRERRPLR